MINQKKLSLQSEQKANEQSLQQESSFSQENLTSLKEEQLEAVVGGGAGFSKCCGKIETGVIDVLAGGGETSADRRKANDALINEWHKIHNTPEKVASPSYQLGYSATGKLEKKSPAYNRSFNPQHR